MAERSAMSGFLVAALLQSAAALGPRYTVQEGDQLEMIASMHGMSTTELAHINRLPDRNQIQAGWVLNTTVPSADVALLQGRHWHRTRDNPCAACCACLHWRPNHQSSCRWTRCPGMGGTQNFCWDQGEMDTKLEGGDKVPSYGRFSPFHVKEPERFEIPKGATGYKDPSIPKKAMPNHPFGDVYYDDYTAADWKTCASDLGTSPGSSEFKEKYPNCDSPACRYEKEVMHYPESSADKAPLRHPGGLHTQGITTP